MNEQYLNLSHVGSREDVSLCLLVKNGESVLRRLLDCVGPHVAEVAAVLDDCTDDTVGMLGALALTHRLDLTIASISPSTHPHFYLLDVPETYEEGRPLCGEHLPGPHEERPFLADFAGARNVGFCLCGRPWRLFLDVDDVVLDPESIDLLCAALDRRGLDAVATPYHAPGRAPGMRERLCRNLPEIAWEGRVHERLAGYRLDRIATIADRLVVRDLGDSTGEGTRIPNRNLKILYHHARSRRWNVTPREAYYLGVEALRAGMLGLAADAAEDCAGRSSHPEERASVALPCLRYAVQAVNACPSGRPGCIAVNSGSRVDGYHSAAGSPGPGNEYPAGVAMTCSKSAASSSCPNNCPSGCVTGTISYGQPPAYSASTLPVPSHTLSTTHVVSPPAVTLRPAGAGPEYYEQVDLDAGGVITLEHGLYVVNRLNLNPGGTLQIDDSGGPVVLWVLSDLSPSSNVKVASGDPSRFWLVYDGTNDVNNNTNNDFVGVLFAPAAQVNLNYKIRGAVVGGKVTLNSLSAVHFDLDLACP